MLTSFINGKILKSSGASRTSPKTRGVLFESSKSISGEDFSIFSIRLPLLILLILSSVSYFHFPSALFSQPVAAFIRYTLEVKSMLLNFSSISFAASKSSSIRVFSSLSAIFKILFSPIS